MKKRVYLDTSVVGGCFDDEFSVDTIPFFERVKKGKITIIVFDILVEELENAPDFVKEVLDSIPDSQIEKVKLSQKGIELADQYIEEKVVGKTSLADCRHIATATLCNADVLVSWNFKHIVNLDRIRGYNGINYKNGYKIIEIRTPKEIMKYENEE